MLRGCEELSYSQCGEDRIIRFIFNRLGVENPTYIDIGAHHPTRYSNTYLFYRNGSRGVCVEPNPKIFSHLKRIRPGDVCLNVGVGGSKQRAVPFYEMDSDTLSTFSEVEAKAYVSEHGRRIINVAPIDIIAPQDILEKNFKPSPDFVSLDVEGLELEILRAFDLEISRPAVFCVETISYATDGTGEKQVDIIDYLSSCGYMVYADTYINTIFVDKSRWIVRQ